MTDLEFTWTVSSLLALLALVQLLAGFALGALWERRRAAKEALPVGADRRAKQVVQWICGILDDSSHDQVVSLDKVEQICSRLENMERLPGSEVTQLMIDVVNEVVRSNEHLRDQLTSLRIQLRQQNSELETQHSQAMTDALTELPNRRALDLAFRRRFVEWKVSRAPLVVALFDIDRFKQLNDTYGHVAGDKVLQAVAILLRGAFRTSDLVGRFGGEEFAVVLPGCELHVAETAIGAALAEIEQSPVPVDGLPLHVTLSAGLVAATDQTSLVELLRQADEALYASKQAGRNCGHVFEPGGCRLLRSDGNFARLSDRTLLAYVGDNCEMHRVRDALRERLAELHGLQV